MTEDNEPAGRTGASCRAVRIAKSSCVSLRVPMLIVATTAAEEESCGLKKGLWRVRLSWCIVPVTG